MAVRALREQWASELTGIFRSPKPKNYAAAVRDTDPELPSSTILPPVEDRAEVASLPPASGRDRTEAMVAHAGDMFRSARANVEAAEFALEAARQSSAEQLNAKHREIVALQDRLSAARERFDALLETEGQKILDAQAEAEAAEEIARSWEERAARAEAEADRKADELAMAIRSTKERLFAAETRAQEAKDDLAYLRELTLKNFGLEDEDVPPARA
jgi:hypothetical protein